MWGAEKRPSPNPESRITPLSHGVGLTSPEALFYNKCLLHNVKTEVAEIEPIINGATEILRGCKWDGYVVSQVRGCSLPLNPPLMQGIEQKETAPPSVRIELTASR